ncbi:MAG: tetratricopeptide repeat protein, partial [bacterium]|nr:tetratricopeptide repeat protein [bacterium]
MILDNTGEKPAAWRGRMAILLIVLAGASAYLNSFPGVFLFDGAQGLFDGPTPDQGAVWDTTVDGRQPLVRISLAINHTISGFAVWSYHAFNIAVHILAGLILFGVVGRTLSAATNRAPEGRSASWLALIVALIWVVHPLQTASVTCIAYRGEVMTGAFYLLTVYALVRGACAAQPMGWYGLSVLCCAAGMGCSLTMITAPVVAVLYDRAFLSRSFRELWGRRLGLYAGLAATWGVPAALGNVPGAISLDYALAQPSVILHYLRLCFWPQGLCLDYGGPVATTALAAPAILLLVAGSLWAWRSRRWLGFAGTCFFLLLAPTSSSIPTEQPVSEQRMYLPLTAVIVVVVVAVRRLLGSGLHRVAQKRPRVRAGAGGILAGLAIAALGYASVERNQDYQSALTMWADVLEQRPQNLRAHHQLSVEHRRLGNLDQAAAHARAALKAQPDDATAHHDLALALRGQGMIDEAITHYRHALEQRPTWAEAYHNLGLGLFDRGAFEESISSLQQSLRLQPNRSESHCQLARALVADNRLDEAAEHCGEAIRKAPSYAEA